MLRRVTARHARHFLGSILFSCCIAAFAADEFNARFAVVMIDDATEKRLGPFPYDRDVLARAVAACDRAGAKAVVLKFFLDQPKTAAGDAALAAAMKKIPVAVQSRLESSEGTTESIPERLSLGRRKLPAALSGDRGWIPLPALLESAAKLGFVDALFAVNGTTFPLVENYAGKSYRSLVVCCLEFALDAEARFEPGRLYVGGKHLAVDPSNALRITLDRLEDIRPLSLVHLLEPNSTSEELSGKVVIIAYNAKSSPTVKTKRGPMKVHEFFLQSLAECHRRLGAP